MVKQRAKGGTRGITRVPPLSLLLLWLLSPVTYAALATENCQPTVQDAAKLTRIQEAVPSIIGPVAAVSPDGRRLAAVVWRGDLLRNLNSYSLLTFESDASGRRLSAPRTLAVREFKGYADGDDASAFEQIRFLADNRTIAFLGQDERDVAQVFTVDSLDGRVRQLTHYPSRVRSFVVGPTGNLLAFSSVTLQPDAQLKFSRLDEDGVFLWDPTLFEARGRFMKAAPIISLAAGQIREYYRIGAAGPELFFSSLWSKPAVPLNLGDPAVASGPTKELHEEVTFRHWATLSGDGQGRRALLFPYGLTNHPMNPERWTHYQNENHYTRRVAAPYGVVDFATGRIERLIDAPHPQFEIHHGGGEAVWSPDGSSAVIYTLDPIEGNAANRARATAHQPHWVEVNLDTRQRQSVPAPRDWAAIHWDPSGHGALILQKREHIGRIPRSANGRWLAFEEIGRVAGLSGRYELATNGRVALGVAEAPEAAPELVAIDLKTAKTTVLTELNPQLRNLCRGITEVFQWSSAHERNAGFLIRPPDFEPGRRYPLVIMLDDGFLGQSAMPFIFDGVEQLNAHAPQALAAQGFVVLYARSPPSMAQFEEKMEGGERMREMVESAISVLDRAGLIDSRRVGISGWSRAAYYTDYILIHSAAPFAAASQVDGGAVEYVQGARPFSDAELTRIGAPLLLEPHGQASLVIMAAMADRLEALGKPTEILYFHSASHDVVRPQHRLRSLGTHLDWWRFWLMGEEDNAPDKATQYARWRGLRSRQRDPSSR